MSFTEMRNAILFRYHKDINYWWKLLGEMFEGTDGFTKEFQIRRVLDGKVCFIRWNDYSWDIDNDDFTGGF